MQILVARDELAECVGGQQRFAGVERTALVDVDQPAVQRRALGLQLVLRTGHAARCVGYLLGDRGELAVERLDDARRGIGASIQVRDLFVEIVDARSQFDGTALELFALAADAVELLLLRAEAL